jgi:hypothetical protein
MLKIIENITKWFSRLGEKTPCNSAVRVLDGAVQFYNGVELSGAVDLASVKEVFAFKRDLFTTDVICIGLRVDDSGTYCEVAEDYGGYEAFLEAIGKEFTGIDEDWFSEVAFPAFKPNVRSLWGEPLMDSIWKT